MSTMDQWTAAVCADLGLDPSDADLRAVLDLTRDVAHGVARPAAPLTAYLVGVAVGRGLALPDAAARISALADGWGGEEAQAAPHHGRDLQTERSRLMPSRLAGLVCIDRTIPAHASRRLAGLVCHGAVAGEIPALPTRTRRVRRTVAAGRAARLPGSYRSPHRPAAGGWPPLRRCHGDGRRRAKGGR